VPQPVADRVGIVLCRGRCCGPTEPRHAEALRAFCAEHPAAVQLQITGCLDRCTQSSVVVLRPSRAGRRRCGRPVWLGHIDEAALVLLQQWVNAGGPGRAPIPAGLVAHKIRRSRTRLPAGL